MAPKERNMITFSPFWQGVGDISYSLSRTNQETARWFWLRHERRAGILWTCYSVCRRLRSYVLGLSSSVVGLKAKVNLFYFTWRIIPLIVHPIVFQGYIHPFGGWPWDFRTINSGYFSGRGPTPISEPWSELSERPFGRGITPHPGRGRSNDHHAYETHVSVDPSWDDPPKVPLLNKAGGSFTRPSSKDPVMKRSRIFLIGAIWISFLARSCWLHIAIEN